MKIAIVGLGLIGGSFAKAIREKTNHHVLGFDLSTEVLSRALADGVIQETVETDFSAADLILVALYPHQTVDFVCRYLPTFRNGCTVIDLCGVKRFVCEQLEPLLEAAGITFIGGHPMAGREFSGYDHAIPTLFEDASMILTPTASTPHEAVEEASRFFRSVGFGHIELTTPRHHDKMIAYTSQLAHVVSSAYIRCPEALDYQGFSAGSFKDLTRVAKLNEFMWTELFLHNGDFLAQQIDEIIANLSQYRDLIRQNDQTGLQNALREGRKLKEQLG